MEEILKNSYLLCFCLFVCGVGYVINDVIWCLLFLIVFVFLMKVVNMFVVNLGWIIFYICLIGVLVFRFVVGFLCDRVYILVLLCKFGKWKFWYLIGSVVIVIFVFFFYIICFVCGDDLR